MSMTSLQQQEEEASTSHNSPRINSPVTTQLRQRRHRHSMTNVDEYLPSSGKRPRRNSSFSDTVSEARQSIKSSTDNLLLPRAEREIDLDSRNNDSPWQSTPLALALLPAIAGVLFQNGSAIFTDITLLALAAVFLNWSIRLPWEWYYSSQRTVERNKPSVSHFDLQDITEEIPENDHKKTTNSIKEDKEPVAEEDKTGSKRSAPPHLLPSSPELNIYNKASHELHINELAALASCFLLPVFGTYLLHTIRSQLSRPSEGLVSNYNLTIFLLAAEIRPVSHLLKMVQTRTLHLQRVIESNKPQNIEKHSLDSNTISDISNRLGQLEASMEQVISQNITETHTLDPGDPFTKGKKPQGKDTEYIISEVLKATRPNTDALNRATRKLEKRIAVSSFDTETRLHSLEAQLQELRSIIGSIQRNSSDTVAKRFVSALKVITFTPLQVLSTVFSFLVRIPMWPYRILLRLVGFGKEADGRKLKGR